EVEFVLADALDELSGKHATKARMGALDGEKRKFDGYVRSVAEQARALNDAIKSGDPEKIAEAAAAFTGDDPDELMGGFYENVAPRLQEYYSLDEAERQAVDLERKGRAVKRKEERVKTREQTAEETTALQEHFRSLSKEYQLDTEGLRAGDDELSQLYQDGKLKGTRYAEVIEK